MATPIREICSTSTPSKTFCEFFAGIGLVREGLTDSGWECVYANDNDPSKRLQYQTRFGDDHFHLEDVRETEQGFREFLRARPSRRRRSPASTSPSPETAEALLANTPRPISRSRMC
jgi:hypothetical protein